MNLHLWAGSSVFHTVLDRLQAWMDEQPLWASFAIMAVAAVALLALFWLLPEARGRRREARRQQADRTLFR